MDTGRRTRPEHPRTVETVTLPLAPMATAGIVAPGTWMTLRIAFQPTAAYTADFRIGNLRIEHR